MFDVSELPEMQVDMAAMVTWLKIAVDAGVINRNEFRLGMRFTKVDDKNMDVFTVQQDILSLSEALDNTFGI
jgi:hypothetical protein